MATDKKKNRKNAAFSSEVNLGFDLDFFCSLSQMKSVSPLDLSTISAISRRSGTDQIVLHLRSKSEAEILKLCNGSGKTCLKIEPKPDLISDAVKARPSSVCFVSRINGRPAPMALSDSSLPAIKKAVLAFKARKISVGVSVKAEAVSLRRVRALGADFVEICALDYAQSSGKKLKDELEQLQLAVYLASELDLKPWLACGINYQNARALSQIPRLFGINVGWAVAAHAILWGLKSAVGEMKVLVA